MQNYKNLVPEIREMVLSDAEHIAQIHAQSWRTTYRGILTQEYLDGHVFCERLALWKKRIEAPAPESVGFVAMLGDSPVAFIFAYVSHDAEWGTLVDNLHVAANVQRRGIARTLLLRLGVTLVARGVTDGVYLEVYEDNQGARAFYETLKGRAVLRRQAPTPDGGTTWEWVYTWPTVQDLSAACRKRE